MRLSIWSSPRCLEPGYGTDHGGSNVFLDAKTAPTGRGSMRSADLDEADKVSSPISVADDGSIWDAGRRTDIAYRRGFLEANGGFPVGPDYAGQEDLLLGLRCLCADMPISRGRRRSERLRTTG
jgi:hypothetical protein